MIKYYKIFKIFCKNSLSAYFAYKSNFFLNFFMGLGWALTGIATINLVFLHTDSLNGWDKTDLILLYFTLELAFELGISLGKNLNNLAENIRWGEFDFIVTKPIDSQFLTTFLKPDFGGFMFFIFHQTPLIYLLIKYNFTFDLKSLFFYILLIINANIIIMSYKTILNTLNFWFINLDNIQGFVFTFLEAGKFPITILPKFLKMLFFTIIPVAFVSLVPAEALLGRLTINNFIWSYVVTIVFLVMARIFWKFGIKHYSSASS